MQETAYKTELLTQENADGIKEVYDSFRLKAIKEYRLEIEPLDFFSFKEALATGILNGIALYENGQPAGILIFVKEEHKAIELNIIHIPDKKELNKKRLELTGALLDHLKTRTDWKVISYPLLGFQETFTRDIALLKFQLIGQAIVKFDFSDPVAYKVLQKSDAGALPSGYSIESWDNKYSDAAAEVINIGFKNSKDVNFDPRFATKEGCKDIIDKITGNFFGNFMPEETKILLKDGQVEGVCFVNLSTAVKANIPLVSVKKNIRNKGLGKLLLKSSVIAVIKAISEQRISVTEINAAVETDNYPALKMYRKIGFREDYTYPHAYFKNNNYKD
jgi:GNAT superfamily N-acetyltransferase